MRRACCWIVWFCLCLGSAWAQTAELDFLRAQYLKARSQDDYQHQKQYALLWLGNYEKSGQPRTPLYAEMDNALAFCFFREGDYDNCLHRYREAWTLSPSTISSADYLSYADSSAADSMRLKRMLLEVLRMEELTAGRSSCSYARTMIRLARFYDGRSPQLAKPFYMQAVQILRQAHGLSSQLPAVLRLVWLQVEDADISAASSLLQEVEPLIPQPSSEPFLWGQWVLLRNRVWVMQFNRTAAERFLADLPNSCPVGVAHPYAGLCVRLAQADLEHASQRDAEAAAAYQEVISRLQGQPDSLGLRPYALLQLGLVYADMDNLRAAEVLYLDLLRQPLAPFVRKSALERLADIYVDLGDYRSARRMYLEVVSIVANLYGTDHVEYAKALNNLAGLAVQQGQLDLAQRAYVQSISILKRSDIPALYSLTLCNLANVYTHQGRSSDAETCYRVALALLDSTLGRHSMEYSDALNNMAIMYHLQGDYQRAYRFYSDAMTLRDSLSGTDSRKYLESQACLFRFYSDYGLLSVATPLLQSILQKKSDQVRQEFWHLTERQRRAFWNENRQPFEVTYPDYIYLHREDTLLRALAYDNELFVKGLLLSATTQIRAAIDESRDPQLQEIYAQLNANRELLMYYQQAGRSLSSLDSLRRLIERQDKQLVLRCGEYREQVERSSVTWRTVQSRLAADEVAVEFSSFPLGDTTHYVALLIRRDMPCPAYVELGTGEAIAALSQGIQPGFVYTQNAQALYHLIWQPLEPYLHPHETVFFAASGLLHQINFSALRDASDSTLDVRQRLVRLSSTREVAFRDPSQPLQSAALYGDVSFNEPLSDQLAESRRYRQSALPASSVLDGDTVLMGAVPLLPWTKLEVQTIDTLLQRFGLSASLYTLGHASEESFKALSGQQENIMHLATHGFFWTSQRAQRKDYFAQRLQQSGTSQSINPLDRCGLYMAGAHTALSGHSRDLPEGVQDGILTAREISLMDLRGCDLVVLSACETAKGEVTSEGVFGLQRAFKMAGVQTIIMSLWPVSDASTQMLMTEFYRNWIQLGQSKRDAFRNAQNAVRYATDSYGNPRFDSPLYWAGFIMLD